MEKWPWKISFHFFQIPQFCPPRNVLSHKAGFWRISVTHSSRLPNWWRGPGLSAWRSLSRQALAKIPPCGETRSSSGKRKDRRAVPPCCSTRRTEPSMNLTGKARYAVARKSQDGRYCALRLASISLMDAEHIYSLRRLRKRIIFPFTLGGDLHRSEDHVYFCRFFINKVVVFFFTLVLFTWS